MNLKLYQNYIERLNYNGVQYYSIKLNVNSVEDIILVKKPYHSYTFKINNTFLSKDIDKYYVISSIKLSIVNINDTEILSTSDTSVPNNLTINIPYNSNLYDTNNKLYFKLECEFAQQDNLVNKLKQGYYARTNTGDAFKAITNKFVEYIPIIIDKNQ